MSVVLEILEGCFTLEASLNNLEEHKTNALEISTKILTIQSSPNVEANNKNLLSTLFPQKLGYHNHKGTFFSKIELSIVILTIFEFSRQNTRKSHVSKYPNYKMMEF